MKKMIIRMLRRLGYVKFEYGFACGRHWMEIDGRMFAQSDDDVRVPDEFVERICHAVANGGGHKADEQKENKHEDSRQENKADRGCVRQGLP